MTPDGSWAIIVHGGAKEIKPEEEDDNRAGIIEAVQAGRAILARGGSALDAVEAAIRVLEDLPEFNAGHGSALNAAGGVEMCAGLMDGRDRSVGSVAVIRDVRNPIRVARQVLPEKEILIAGEGALLFARERGLELASNEELASGEPAAPEQEHDTVGAVAFDSSGNFAAGTSTGGLSGSRVGRVGDSPLPGAGLFADNHIGAVSLSGDGESIARLTLASCIMGRINEDGPERAIAAAIEQLPGVGGEEGDGGAIAIAKDGRLGWGHNSPHFAVAMITNEMNEPSAWLRKEEAEQVNG
jgi:beta-aspartyl-peptidase (threonine type)